jgi:hypothetical protein
MAVNPNVVVHQVQQAVQVPLPADDPALFGASLLVIGFNVDTIMFLGTQYSLVLIVMRSTGS